MSMALTQTMKLVDTQGSVLTGRAAAARIADDVTRLVQQGTDIVLDFAGVQALSPSFADELFGKLLLTEAGRHIRVVNLSQHLDAVARMAQQRRSTGD